MSQMEKVLNNWFNNLDLVEKVNLFQDAEVSNNNQIKVEIDDTTFFSIISFAELDPDSIEDSMKEKYKQILSSKLGDLLKSKIEK